MLVIAALGCLLLLRGAWAQTDGEVDDEPIIEQGELQIEEEAEDPPPSQPAAPVEQSATMPDPDAPSIPSLDDVMAGKNRVQDFIPMNFDFRVGLIGDIVETIETYDGGTTTQTKSPLLLLDPRSGSLKVTAKNFPAKIIANSDDGQWVVAIAPSSAVEGTSGSSHREAAVSLNMLTGEIRLIAEFPRHSNFQALFLADERHTILYCVNEPGAVNQIQRFNLETRTPTALPAEGNRFHIYGLRKPTQGQGNDTMGLWVRDPMSVSDYPVVSLLDLQRGLQLQKVDFPGVTEVLAQPDGSTLLATIKERGETSLGYYDVLAGSYRQINDLVLNLPQSSTGAEIKWTNNSDAVIVKESTTTRDRFLWIDLATGAPRELFSAYYKIGQWDISPNDDALVFIVNASDSPVLFVLPLDPNVKGINRIRLRDMSNVKWIGCLNPSGSERGGGKGWWDKLIPRF